MTPALLARTDSKIVVVQGEYRISSKPEVVLSTLLGSCVAMCLHDPVARVGGMNHFLLPGTDREEDGASSLRYGAYAMDGLTDLGSRNAEFAQDYVRRENIVFAGGSLRGERGRRIEFWPHSGRTRQIWVGGDAPVFAAERYVPPVAEPGTVELF
jgi:chemotaxis protein CheD